MRTVIHLGVHKRVSNLCSHPIEWHPTMSRTAKTRHIVINLMQIGMEDRSWTQPRYLINLLDNFAERWRVNHNIFYSKEPASCKPSFIDVWAKILRFRRTLDLDVFLAANHFVKSVIINNFFLWQIMKNYEIMKV